MPLRPPLILLLFLLFSACTTVRETPPDASLRNTRWVLRTLAATPINTLESSQEIYLQLNATTNQLDGYAGCNRYFGRFEQPTATTLRLLNIGSTRMFCEARQQLETNYLKALQDASRFEIQGNTLRLYAEKSDEPLAVFEAVYLK
ncbi:hypothetical protein GCM10011375_19810 [Hymenobacter qilianensis]|uniref:META domain-containing protein n=2 Tax=Hymenobacter qilianensis TaxID=1385715 RepID=A0A7H0GV38_9BACT|nr:META domain-containing protein [Hymenobacter qilianensis]QNP52154.1 META domain-containing protein [Hymenobacter qilianensis]GGF64897.1 hypothetical protein GCM10011375_19810 [Hymenobacter qilianensis]